MPKPPNFDGLTDLKFITNYVLAGCTPPTDLFVEFATPASNDLAMLLFIPSLDDIGQAIFDPRAGRKRKPARHGKKKRRIPTIPDTSDLVGMKARGFFNPGNVMNFGLTRKAFRLLNAYEGIAFTAALMDGLTDIGFSGLHGIFTVDPTHCQNFDRLSRRKITSEVAGGVGPPIWPISIPVLEFSNGFSSTQHACNNFSSDYAIALQMQVGHYSGTPTAKAQIALGVIGGPIRALSRVVELAIGDTVTLEINANFKAGEWCEWGIGTRADNPAVVGAAVLAYGKSDWPWPWK